MTKYQQVPESGQSASLSEADRITRPEFIDLPMTGLEGPLSEEERALQESVHRGPCRRVCTGLRRRLSDRWRPSWTGCRRKR
jgi:hypothetical protein